MPGDFRTSACPRPRHRNRVAAATMAGQKTEQRKELPAAVTNSNQLKTLLWPSNFSSFG